MLLTADQLRAMLPGLPTGTEADMVVQMLLDATEADILSAVGPTGSRDEYVSDAWGYPTLVVAQPIGSVTTVTEDPLGTPRVLASDDYRHIAGGYVLRRLASGTNPASTWARQVRVQYVTPEDADRRGIVQLGLCKLATSYNPGLLSTRVGDWQETYQSTDSVSGYAMERASLLASLTPGPAMVVL